ncbi:MAG: transglycosylase SLT domain-containing protein [Armatimonadota bacterium]|nr:transglycosylase SLT domain-containing protein [Armatimonadota bacterium]MDR5697174.1 transglycosylase SLT domain-containing protein [Armatimonadota bacterium]
MNFLRAVRLGATYLAGRLADFGGDVALALAAYNAGPGAARRFARFPRGRPDEFVERIPFGETRGYVQRVLESYGIYRWLYR